MPSAARDKLPLGAPAIALQTPPDHLIERINAYREREPDPFVGEPAAVEAYVREAAELLAELEAAQSEGMISYTPSPQAGRLPNSEALRGQGEGSARYLHEAAARAVRFARARLDQDRHNALSILERLFGLGSVPAPDGRYEGELVGVSTGLLSDPFFEWITRIYLPWQGKTFDAASSTGDNVFSENVWSRGMSMIGWPEYRIPTNDLPGRVRVFPFRSTPAPGIENPTGRVLRLDYADSPNPLPVRRMVDEIVELPGGYMLGKGHMRGVREFRRVCYFGLTKVHG